MATKTTPANIRRKIRHRINDLPQKIAMQTLEDIADLKKRNYGLGNRLWVRLLSGGFWSQSLDEFTMRELGIRAGVIKKF